MGFHFRVLGVTVKSGKSAQQNLTRVANDAVAVVATMGALAAPSQLTFGAAATAWANAVAGHK